MERCDLGVGRRRETRARGCSAEASGTKLTRELGGTGARPEEGAALRLQLRRSEPRPEHWALPKPQGSRYSPSLRRHSRPHLVRRPGPLRTRDPGPAHCSRVLPGAAGSSAFGRVAAPCAPPSRPAFPLPRSRLGLRSARSSRGCIAGAAAAAAAAGCARAASEARAQGREGLGARGWRPDGAAGPGVLGPGVGGSAGEYTPPVRLCLVARIPEEASWGREPGYGRRARTLPALERTAAAPLAGLPESGRGSRQGRREGRCPARTSPAGAGAAGPRSARTLRPGPPPSSAAPRGSGAVPAQSPRPAAPRPTPASARLPVTWRPRIGARAGPRPVSSPPRPAIGPGGALGLWRGDGGTRSRVFPAAVRGAERVGPGCCGAGPGGAAQEQEEDPAARRPRCERRLCSPRPVSARRPGEAARRVRSRAAAGGGAQGARGRGRGRARRPRGVGSPRARRGGRGCLHGGSGCERGCQDTRACAGGGSGR